MRQLQEIAPSGLNRDLAPWAAPDEWHRAEQIVFRRGYAQTIGRKVNIWNNWDGAGVDLDGPDFLLNYYDGTLSYWLYGCADGVGVTDGASHKTITPGTFTTPLASDAWTGGLLGGVPFLNYGTDPACYWGLDFATPTVMAAMADAPECAAMRPYRSVLVALDTSANTNNGSIDASEEVVAWSKANDAGSVPSAAGDWTPANSNIAGFAPLGPDGGLCIDGLQFRDSFLIGKNNGFWVMDLVGGNEVMAFRRLFQTGGVLARNCMAEVDGNVFVLTDSDIVVTDGNDVRSVVDRRLRQTIFDDLGENFARSWLAYNKQQREVWVAPVRTGEEYAHGVYIYDLDTDKWGYFEPDDGTYDLTHASPGRDSSASNDTYATTTETYDSIDQRYNETVGGQVADVLFWANVADKFVFSGTRDEPRDETALLEKQTIDFGTPLRKTLYRVWPKIEGTGEIDITIGTQDTPDDVVSWGAKQTFDMSSDQKLDTQVNGRYFSFRFEGTGAFSMTSFGCEYAESGRF